MQDLDFRVLQRYKKNKIGKFSFVTDLLRRNKSVTKGKGKEIRKIHKIFVDFTLWFNFFKSNHRTYSKALSADP